MRPPLFFGIYLPISYLLVLYGAGDILILLWPVLISLFFLEAKRLIILSLLIGFILDLHSPLFGLYITLFAGSALLGILLIKTIFSHRTFASLHAVCLLISIGFSAVEYGLYFILNLFGVLDISLPHAGYFAVLRLSVIVLQVFFLSFAFLILQASEKRFGYSIDLVRKI